MAIDMALTTSGTDNRGEEEKGKTGKYRRGKRKGEKNFMPHTTTLSLIIIKQ
jgi:hypothetical protein